jgi:signal transduction histidine kinase
VVGWFTHQRRLLDDATRARLLTTIAWVIAGTSLFNLFLFTFVLDPSMRWVAWICAFYFFLSILMILGINRGLVIQAGIAYAILVTVTSILTAVPEDIVSRPLGSLFVMSILAVGIVLGFNAAEVFAGLIIILIISLPLYTNAPWSPWMPTNVTVISVVVLLLRQITQLVEQLQESNRQLRDAQTETKRANVELVAVNQALEAVNQQLRAYMVQAEDLAVEHERVRVAREIHDGLGHHLNNVKVHVAVARRYFDVDRAIALDSLTTTQSEISNAQQELRRAVEALVSDRFTGTLEELLQGPVRDCQLAGIDASLHVEGRWSPLPQQVTYALYRIGQEALSNIRQHSRAKQASVQIHYQDQCIHLVIDDDGIGMPASTEYRRGHGLDNLQERATLVGGKTIIETRLGQGVRVMVEVPTCGFRDSWRGRER